MDNITSLFSVPGGDWSLTAINMLFDTNGLIAQMLFFYNTAIAYAGVAMMFYLSARAVLDMAHTAKPMGHFSEVWLPIRLGLAITMTVPLPGAGGGLNSAQWIIYQAAKLGIGGADHLWSIAVAGLGKNAVPIVAPPPPAADQLAEGLWMMEVCRAAANKLAADAGTQPWIIAQTVSSPDNYTIAFNGDRSQGFGEGACGAVSMVPTPSHGGVTQAPLGGASVAQQIYDAQIGATTDLQTVISAVAGQFVTAVMDNQNDTALPGPGNIPAAIVAYGTRIQSLSSQLATAQNSQAASNNDAFVQEATAQGWVSAGGYLMQIASINESIMSAAGAVPKVSGPTPAEGFSTTSGAALVHALSVGAQWWNAQMARANLSGTSDNALHAGMDMPTIFGTFGLRASLFQAFVLGPNDLTNPLAALVAMGHQMVRAFWTALLAVTGAVAGLGALKGAASSWMMQIVPVAGTAAKAATAGAVEVVRNLMWFPMLILLGLLSSGVYYAYILPALPFIYWFNSISMWLQRIGVAMMAAPAWGVSHIQGEGTGAISQQAMAGYSLMVETALRPMIMVMSLIISYALVIVVTGLFYPYFQQLVSNNLAGTNDLFTGAVVYMWLGAIMETTLMLGCLKLVTSASDSVVMYMGLQVGRAGDAAEAAAREIESGAGRTGDRLEHSASRTADRSNKSTRSGNTGGGPSSGPTDA